MSPISYLLSICYNCHISFNHIKESPFKELAPIKTSSPILASERDETVDGVRPVADPLLFVEDEEPIGGDLSKASCTQQSEPVKESVNG